MRAMKDSGVDWIGIVPEHWEMRRAKAMFRQSTSKGNDRLVLLSATQDRGVVDKSTLDSVVQVSEDADLSTFKTVHKNDFVISLRSFQGGFEISHEEGVISPAYTVFRLSKQTYPHFYRHLFKSYGFIDKINSLTVGIREGKNIQYVDFADMLLPYIPLAEQQKIAEFLDRKCAEVDEMIGLQEQIIEELKAYKQSVITETVTKGLNPAAPMRDSGIEWIGSIPEHWSTKRLKDVGYLYGGLTGKAGDDFIAEDDETCQYMRFIPYTNIFNNYLINPAQLYKVRIEEGEKQNLVNKGDILFLMSSEDYDGVGKPAMIDVQVDNLGLNSFCKGFRITDNYTYPKFLLYLLLSHTLREMVRQEGKGFIRINLRQDKLSTCPIVLPDIAEQQAIADYLDEKCADIDSLIQTKQEKIDSLKEYKKSIIYEYVTGKKEVEYGE